MKKLILGNILDVAHNLPKIDCVVTSPPYYKLRDYGHDCQIGQERNVNEYVNVMVKSFSMIRENMAETGSLFMNLGDKYLNGKLAGVPWRVALALVDDGWVLRNDIIWDRNRIMPSSAKNRFTGCHEYIFFLTLKKSGYTFNADAVRETAKWAHDPRAGKGRQVVKNPTRQKDHTSAVFIASDGKRNRRTLWTIETAQSKKGDKHSATFPVELPEICVLAGSNLGDTVLDPCVGSGTTGVAALKNGRNFIGVDISKEYIDISQERLKDFS